MFVVVLTDEGQLLTAPRAVGPFEDFDIAMTFMNTLLDKWQAEQRDVPVATVVRVENQLPGVVVGEL